MSAIKRSVVIYAGAFAVAGATPFLLLPVLTGFLSPAQFGEITSFLIFTTLLGNFAGLSTHGFISVRYFKTEQRQHAELVGTSVIVLALSHSFAFAIAWILHSQVEKALGLTLAQAQLAVLAAFFLCLCQVGLALFQSSGQPIRYLQVRLIQGGVELGLGIVLVVWLFAEAISRTASYTFALAVSATFGLWTCFRGRLFVPNFDLSQVKGLLMFGLPLMPHIVAGTMITYLDRLVVSSVLGANALGQYMVAMQIGMVIVAITEPLNKALAPWLFEQLSRQGMAVRRMIVRRTYQLFLALILIGLVVSLVAQQSFGYFIDERYEAARELIPWMVAGFVMQGLYAAVVNYLFYAERTGWLSLVSASAAIIGGFVSWLLVTNLGIRGAAISFTINSALLFILVWVVAERAVPMPWALSSDASSD